MGNICRSPTAEGVMRGLLREQGLEDSVEVDSAGTGDWHAGAPPDERATAAARARGIALEGAARVVARGDFDDFDLILAADRAQPARPRAPPRRPGRARAPAPAARVRSRPRRARRTSTCPTPTTAATTASSTCSTSSRRPAAACSTRCAPTAGCDRRRRRHGRSAARSPPRAASPAATSTTPGWSSSTAARARS